MKDKLSTALIGIYILGDIGTIIYLTLFDGVVYTWWNWIFLIPLNFIIAQLWPFYWGIFRWIF